MKDAKAEPENIVTQNSEFIKARRKLDRYAFDKTLEEYKKDNTIDFQKRKDEIIKEELLELKKRMQERKDNDLLSGINKLVAKNSDVDARYKDLISEEAYEKLEIRKKADKILEELKKEQQQREIQSKKVKPSVINKYDEIKRKIEEEKEARKLVDIEATRKRNEAYRRVTHATEKKRYDDRQGKLANLVEQLAFITKTQNETIQSRSTSSIQRTEVQKQNVRPYNIESETPIPEKVVIKEVEPTPQKEEKPVQALVPKKQKPSFMDRIHSFRTKVSEAAVTAYEMLTFKHNRDTAVGKRKERTVSPAEASNAYEKNMIHYSNSQPKIDIRSQNKKTPTSFLEHLQAKADEKAAMEAMKSKSKNGNSRNSDQRGA